MLPFPEFSPFSRPYLPGRIKLKIRGRHNTRRKISMDKVIITVVGKDTVGIIAKVCTYLADHKINILDISQTIVQEYFNMMMIVDGSGASVSFDEMASGLDEIGAGIGVNIKCQREEIFTKMHRI